MDDKFRLRQKVAVLIACLPGILFRNASVFKHVRGETKINVKHFKLKML